jgi:lincosamide nucleotidyltransferase A/C/D/E
MVQDGLRAIGFTHAAQVEPGLPARLVLVDPAGRQVDVHPVIFDQEGNGWQRLDGGAWGQYPADGLAGSGTIGEKPVACITAALQLRHHLGYAWSRDDRRDMGLLAARFGLSLPPED